MRILIVEDNELVADALMRMFKQEGFEVDHASKAEDALPLIQERTFDLAIVDIGLPGVDGLTLVRTLRARRNLIPITILTARQTVGDKVKAFDLGADDFVIKPFDNEELLARCRALIRRANLANSGKIKIDRIEIDLYGKQLSIHGQAVELTAREWSVLECLARQPGTIVAKEKILNAMGASEHEVTANALEVHVSRLRNKLRDAAAIRSVRGLGYRIEEAKRS